VFWSRPVTPALGKDLSTVIVNFLTEIYSVLWGSVILTLETLALTALLGEQSTGLSGSDLLETA
jgi:hypothetical protein